MDEAGVVDYGRALGLSKIACPEREPAKIGK
jgi:hypothetical protein